MANIWQLPDSAMFPRPRTPTPILSVTPAFWRAISDCHQGILLLIGIVKHKRMPHFCSQQCICWRPIFERATDPVLAASHPPSHARIWACIIPLLASYYQQEWDDAYWAHPVHGVAGPYVCGLDTSDARADAIVNFLAHRVATAELGENLIAVVGLPRPGWLRFMAFGAGAWMETMSASAKHHSWKFTWKRKGSGNVDKPTSTKSTSDTTSDYNVNGGWEAEWWWRTYQVVGMFKQRGIGLGTEVALG